jgi:hypothetical protein
MAIAEREEAADSRASQPLLFCCALLLTCRESAGKVYRLFRQAKNLRSDAMIKRNERYRVTLIVAVVFFLSGASFHTAAQQSQSKCPTTKMTCPDLVKIGEKLTFTANVQGGDQNVTPTYNWTVSAGAISSGQGTSTVIVDTKGLTENTSVTATVELGGFDRECGYGSTVQSCTSSVEK